MPAIRLPRVCWAARPKITAVNAPPTAIVWGPMPATFSAISSVIPSVASRIRKPTVPAVAGSMRRKNVGAAARPMSRAIAQPITSRTSTVTIRIAVSQWLAVFLPRRLSRCVVEHQHRDQQWQQDRRLALGPADRTLADGDRQSDALPGFAAGLEHSLEMKILA